MSEEIDAIFIAPDERVSFSQDGEIGPEKAKFQDINGEYSNSNDKSMSNEKGNWRVFYKGQVIGTFKENPQNLMERLNSLFFK